MIHRDSYFLLLILLCISILFGAMLVDFGGETVEKDTYYRFDKWSGKIESWDDGWCMFENSGGFGYDKVLDGVKKKEQRATVWILDEYENPIRKFLKKRIVVKVEYKGEKG